MCRGGSDRSTEANAYLNAVAQDTSASQAVAASNRSASKYRILAIVNGLHTLAVHFSHV